MSPKEREAFLSLSSACEVIQAKIAHNFKDTTGSLHEAKELAKLLEKHRVHAITGLTAIHQVKNAKLYFAPDLHKKPEGSDRMPPNSQKPKVNISSKPSDPLLAVERFVNDERF